MAENSGTPPVTGATPVTHRSGDNPVDSVDNTVQESSPRVITGPNGRPGVPRSGTRPTERSRSGTKRDNAAEPNGKPDGEDERSSTQGSGRDLARAALEAARKKAEARGVEPGVRKLRDRGAGTTGGLGQQSPRRRRWSGPGADQRDPQQLGRLTARLAVERGWNSQLANGQVFGQWTRLVGEEVAGHAQPVTLRDGELTVRASSTAWATQLRLLQAQLLTKIAAGVGHGVVKRMRIQGPTAPSWRKGPRHVSGRGPRDTYG
jgi:predicted nucleic acid-binding Zn ribbon protein